MSLDGVSIFIPVLNEGEIIQSTVERVFQYLEPRIREFEIIIVDNGSSDNTSEICRAYQKKDPRLKFFSIKEKGPGRALRIGLKEAVFPWVLTLDADLSSDLLFIDYALDLRKYCDMIIGSKTMGQQRRSFVRVLGSQTYLLCAQLVFNLTLSDYSIGSKAFRREPVLKVIDHLDTWTGYILEIALYFSQAKKRVIQVGIDCEDNRESHFNILHEGYYRFKHLYQAKKLIKNQKSWLSAAANELAGV